MFAVVEKSHLYPAFAVRDEHPATKSRDIIIQARTRGIINFGFQGSICSDSHFFNTLQCLPATVCN